MLSIPFWTYYAPFVLVFMVSAVVVAAFLAIGRDSAGSPESPESRWLWVKPVLVYAGIAGIWNDLTGVHGGLIFAMAFVAGLTCGLTAYPPYLIVRDWILDVVSIIVVVIIVAARFAQGGATAVSYLVLLAALAAGLALGGLRRLKTPTKGIALLAGVEILDFFYSPFGTAQFVPDGSLVIWGAVAAAAIGFAIRVSATLVMILAGLSVAMLSVFLQFFLWLEQQNNPTGLIAPEWTGALAWFGVALGYGLMRPAYTYMSRRWT